MRGEFEPLRWAQTRGPSVWGSETVPSLSDLALLDIRWFIPGCKETRNEHKDYKTFPRTLCRKSIAKDTWTAQKIPVVP